MGGEAKEACGLVAVYDHRNAPFLAFNALTRLEHRGQEGFGLVVRDGANQPAKFTTHYKMGSVAAQSSMDEMIEELSRPQSRFSGDYALGHTRYSTSGASSYANLQPIFRETKFGNLAIAHNGNLTNAMQYRRELKYKEGHIFHGTSDTEVVMHLISTAREETLEDAIVSTLRKLDGSFSFAIMSDDALYVARDKHGFKPLTFGRIGDSFAVASETCALEYIKATIERDVKPGELIVVDDQTRKTHDGYRTRKFTDTAEVTPAFCLFEAVYFMRPDSRLNNDFRGKDRAISDIRMAFGRALAREHPVDADIVAPIPDSGISAAQGYSEVSKIPYMTVHVRSHAGRSFIKPTKELRAMVADFKLAIMPSMVRDKRIIIVDDSIVRGTTSRRRVQELRDAGAKEVHVRISCPPTKHPCHYGIDFPTEGELIAANKSVEEVRAFIGADTLGYLSLEGMFHAAKGAAPRYCTACWTGKYPTKLVDRDKGLLDKVKVIETTKILK
jgi:amidophosphoribosyltransferase